MVEVELGYRENDGAAWYENGRIVINLKWLAIEDEAEWYIDESFIHEYIEHILGLGHAAAVYVEKVLRRHLYSSWYGRCPLAILYATTPSAQSQTVHAAPQRSVSQPRGEPAPLL